MALSPWKDVAKIQTATCNHAGTSTVDGAMTTCSVCGTSWPTDGPAPNSTLTRQVPL